VGCCSRVGVCSGVGRVGRAVRRVFGGIGEEGMGGEEGGLCWNPVPWVVFFLVWG